MPSPIIVTSGWAILTAYYLLQLRCELRHNQNPSIPDSQFAQAFPTAIKIIVSYIINPSQSLKLTDNVLRVTVAKIRLAGLSITNQLLRRTSRSN